MDLSELFSQDLTNRFTPPDNFYPTDLQIVEDHNERVADFQLSPSFRDVGTHQHFPHNAVLSQQGKTSQHINLKQRTVTEFPLLHHIIVGSIVARTIRRSQQSGAHTIFSDEQGHLARISFYNCTDKIGILDTEFPIGTKIAILDPWYKRFADKWPGIRVDDPKKVIFNFKLEEERLDLCASCQKKESLQKCVRCKKVAYCNKECQKKHWPTHKIYCKPASLPIQDSPPVPKEVGDVFELLRVIPKEQATSYGVIANAFEPDLCDSTHKQYVPDGQLKTSPERLFTFGVNTCLLLILFGSEIVFLQHLSGWNSHGLPYAATNRDLKKILPKDFVFESGFIIPGPALSPKDLTSFVEEGCGVMKYFSCPKS